MADFSIGEAVASGFRLVRREPLAIVVWGGVYLLLNIVPQFLIWFSVWPEFSVLLAQSPDKAMSADALAGLQARMLGLQPIIWIATAAMFALLYGAIYRAVLEPENRGSFYLRLGAQELWLLLSSLVLVVLAVIVIIVVAIPVVMVAGATGGATHFSPAAGLAMLAAAAVVIWLMLRFSMVTPMAFSERRFVLMESWRLTKGHTLKILGVLASLVGIVLGIEIVLAIAAMFLLVPWLTAGEGALTTLLSDPDRLVRVAMPFVIVGCAVVSLVAAAFYAFIAAPYATIYARLAAREPETA